MPSYHFARYCMEEVNQRKRARHTRSALGCGVCRIRHVRCDLSRPVCQRCSSTGRLCDGYLNSRTTDDVPKLTERRAAEQALTFASALPDRVAREPENDRRRHHFQQATAVELAGEFADEFWTRLVIQVGHREDCVHYMILALSSLHESHYHASSAPSTRLDAQSTGYYSQALRSLNHHIVLSQGTALDVTLLCCILCATFEWLRDNYSAALVHLRAGLQVLHQWYEASLSSLSPPRTSFWSPNGHIIRSTLSPLYTRISVQVQTVSDHGLILPPVEAPGDGALRPFKNLKEARDSLYGLLSGTYYSADVHRVRRRRRKADSVKYRYTSTHEAHAQWCRHLDDLLTREPEASKSTAAHCLQILRLTTTIMVGFKDSGDRPDFSRQTPQFTYIIELIDQLYSMKMTTFSADMSITSVLYYVAVNCRHPVVRHKALSLLEKGPGREGTVHSVRAALSAKRLVNMEESKTNGQIINSTCK